MSARTFVVARRVLTQLRRDKRTLALIVLQPIVIMSIFGYAFGGDVSGARVAIANLDRGGLGDDVVARLDRTTVAVVEVTSGAEAEAALRRGDVAMAVVIPANFTRNFESSATTDPEPLVLQVYEDNTNTQVTAAAFEALGDAVREALEDETGRATAFVLEERPVYGGEDPRPVDFFLPGIAAFAIFQLGSLLTVVTIVKERGTGTLPRILASPARRPEIVLGYALAFTLLSIVQAAAILSVGVVLFDVDVQGSILLALLVTTLIGVMALGFGILVSGLARSEFQAIQSTFFVVFPMLFLSGVFAPVEAMPTFLRPVMPFIPLFHGVNAVRDTLTYGRTFEDVLPEVFVLVGFAVAFLFLATVSFGRAR